jgi:hypothetical protein
MTDEFKNINKKYNDDTYPEFPYISPNRVTLLSKGLYRKHGAKYRGITAVFNEETGEFTFPLYGMYRVTEDIIIVPTSLQLNENKTSFLTAAIKAGYKQVDSSPTFQPIFFSEDSPEAKLALANKASFYRSKRKDITI